MNGLLFHRDVFTVGYSLSFEFAEDELHPDHGEEVEDQSEEHEGPEEHIGHGQEAADQLPEGLKHLEHPDRPDEA